MTITKDRAILFRTRGSDHGPVTRLVSPGELGQRLKPFVFLDLFRSQHSADRQRFALHPHSGIATLTYMIEGEVAYEDTTGKQGVLPTGGVEWMSAGNGVWHGATAMGTAGMVGFQLWVALPPNEENAPAHSLYLAPADIPQSGPVRVLLGRYGNLNSPIQASTEMTYLAVTLKKGEHWRYTPPAGHTVAWLAVNSGQLGAENPVGAGELVVFDESEQPIDLLARVETSFVLGSAVKHPHHLVMGYYSVHTSEAALALGEAEIRRIGTQLREQGRLD
ncbi:MAG: pirin family protein [Pseudomonadota bacterium]